MSFKTQLTELFDGYKRATADGKVTLGEALSLVASVGGTIEVLLRGIDGDDAAFEQLVADCESIVQTYVVPLDLPVPDFIEPFLDAQLGVMVRPGLMKLRAWVRAA